MNIFGIDLDPLLFLQIAVTAAVITGYYVFNMVRHPEASYLSNCHMILLGLFALRNHSHYRIASLLLELVRRETAGEATEGPAKDILNKAHGTRWERAIQMTLERHDEGGSLRVRPERACHLAVQILLEAPPDDSKEESDYSSSFTDALCRFETTGGTLPLRQKFTWGEYGLLIVVVLISMLLAPVGSWLYILARWKMPVFRRDRIQHTKLREFFFGWGIALVFGNLLLLFIDVRFIQPWSWWTGLVVAVFAIFGLVGNVIAMYVVIQAQRKWKDFWQEKLLEVMALAESQSESGHDLFNRAMILKNYVEAQPDIPVTANWKFVTVVYAGAQLLLVWMSRYLASAP